MYLTPGIVTAKTTDELVLKIAIMRANGYAPTTII
jgi:hypothetical protein